MTVIEIIKQDLLRVFPSILDNPKADLEFEDILDTNHKFIMNILTALSEKDGVDIEEKQSLMDFLLLMERSEDMVGDVAADFAKEIEDEFSIYIDRYPDNKSFQFFLLRFQIEQYIESGMPKNECAEYYNSIFQEHADLVNLSDFTEKSNFLLPILLSEDHPIELVDTFVKAVDSFPIKPSIKFTLSRIYESIGDNENAIATGLLFLDQLVSERAFDPKNKVHYLSHDQLTSEDYDIAINRLANLYYQTNDYDNSKKYCDKALAEFAQRSDEDYSFQMLFFDPLVIKLRIHMKLNNVEGFRKDFELLVSKVEKEDLVLADIKDIMEYSKHL